MDPTNDHRKPFGMALFLKKKIPTPQCFKIMTKCQYHRIWFQLRILQVCIHISCPRWFMPPRSWKMIWFLTMKSWNSWLNSSGRLLFERWSFETSVYTYCCAFYSWWMHWCFIITSTNHSPSFRKLAWPSWLWWAFWVLTSSSMNCNKYVQFAWWNRRICMIISVMVGITSIFSPIRPF